MLTSQLYLPDDVSDEVFTDDLYARGPRDTANDTDAVARGHATNATLLTLRPEGDGHLALVVSASPPERRRYRRPP